jgi:hypothetical protein
MHTGIWADLVKAKQHQVGCLLKGRKITTVAWLHESQIGEQVSPEMPSIRHSHQKFSYNLNQAQMSIISPFAVIFKNLAYDLRYHNSFWL